MNISNMMSQSDVSESWYSLLLVMLSFVDILSDVWPESNHSPFSFRNGDDVLLWSEVKVNWMCDGCS